MASGGIDLSKAGKYPIVLSDALLGKTTKEVYTSIRYNHKPDPSSDPSLQSLNLKPSDDDSSSYDLSLKDKSDKYLYNGTRTTGEGQFVLIFDPVKEHFVLHRIDSTFDMNLVSAPDEQDASRLQSQYSQLGSETKSNSSIPQRKASKGGRKAVAPKIEAPRRKAAEKPKKSKPPVRESTPEEEESDDGLTIEYPDAGPQQQYNAPPSVNRQASEEISDEDEDADHEVYEEEEHNQDVDHLKLPSPANNAGGMSDEDLELELEAELEEALNADESDESEEE